MTVHLAPQRSVVLPKIRSTLVRSLSPVNSHQPPGAEALLVDALTSGPTDEQPALLGYPPPVYPRNPIRLDGKGVVEILVTVDKVGNEIELLVLHSSGRPALDEAALGALHHARFRPGLRNGHPELGRLTVTVRFRVE